MNLEKIPQTDSIQQLAEFWDTHDLTDFEEQLEEITEPVFGKETIVKNMNLKDYPFAQEFITDSQGHIQKVIIKFEDYVQMIEAFDLLS